MIVDAPLRGRVVALADVPDEVFASAMVGPGVALLPDDDGPQRVVAPVAGVVGTAFPHAFAIELDDGRSVLVHLGIDTVTLRGAGFEVHAPVGARVERGDLLVTWSPADVVAADLSPLCPVVALQAEGVDVLVEPGGDVAAGEPLLRWG